MNQTADSCGPQKNVDCCDSPVVTCGEFNRGYDGVDFADDSFPATVSDFRLNRFEVTVARFRRFVEDGGGTVQAITPPSEGDGAHFKYAASGWRAQWNADLAATTAELSERLNCSQHATWTDDPGANETLPIICVSWYEAFAFCIWDDGRLPTEAEWDYAASGGAQHRVYPWSDPPTFNVIDAEHAIFGCDASLAGCDPDSAIAVVGSLSPLGDGPFGHADLTGNVGEWVLYWKDWDDRDTSYLTPCADCVEFASEPDYRAVKGGAFDLEATDPRLKTSGTESHLAASRTDAIGIRCTHNP